MSTRDEAVASRAEPLFACTAEGGIWEFVTLREGGCALLLDGKRITAGDDSPPSVERVMDAFLRAARLRGPATPRNLPMSEAVRR